MTNVRVEQLQIGDKIMPPAREVRLWMRRNIQERNLPESALYLTITNIREGAVDKGGLWLVITADHEPEWFENCKPYPFKFKARPQSLWPKVA